MKKRAPSKKPASVHKKRKPLQGFIEFFVGFFVATALVLLLAQVFRDELFRFIVNLTGS